MARTVEITEGVEVFGEKSVSVHFLVDKVVTGMFIYYPENNFELGKDIHQFVAKGKLPFVGGDGRKEPKTNGNSTGQHAVQKI